MRDRLGRYTIEPPPAAAHQIEESFTMKHFTLAAVGLLTTAAPAFAQGSVSQFLDDIEVEAQFDTLSEYVFRGQSRGAQSITSQNTFTLPGGLSGGAAYIAGIDPDSAVQRDEIRAFVNYAVPLDSTISIDVGGTYYYFPQAGGFFETRGGSAGSYEVYGSVGLDEVFLSPKATVFYDLTLENLTLEGAIEHNFDLPRKGWTGSVGLTAGYVDEDNSFVANDAALDYGYGVATLGLNKVITDNISFHLNGNFAYNSEEDTLNLDRDVLASGLNVPTRDSDTKFWYGTGLKLNF